MSITLTHPTAGTGSTPLALPLPPDLIWTDEHDWSGVDMATERGIGGALIVDAAARSADGRAMTLAGGDEYGWCTRSTLMTLRAWANQPLLELTLLRNGTSHTVIFDNEAGAIESSPVVAYSDPEPADMHVVTLRFLIRA